MEHPAKFAVEYKESLVQRRLHTMNVTELTVSEFILADVVGVCKALILVSDTATV